MNIGVTKIMNRSRGGPEESVVHTVGGSTAANTYSNVPLDKARSVTMETTLNPLSYWPPPSLPSTNIADSKEAVDDPPIDTPGRSHTSQLPKKLNTVGQGMLEAEQDGLHIITEENGHSFVGSNQTPKVLQHNLPPIAGITSSHNYRGARDMQKNAHEETGNANVRKGIPGFRRSNGHAVPEPQNEETAKGIFQKSTSNPCHFIGDKVLDVSRSQKTQSEGPTTDISSQPNHTFSIPKPFLKPGPTNRVNRALTPVLHISETVSKVPRYVPDPLASASVRTNLSHVAACTNAKSTTTEAVTSSENNWETNLPPSKLSSITNLSHEVSKLNVPITMTPQPTSSPNNTQPCLQHVGTGLTNSQSAHPALTVPNLPSPSIRHVQPDSSRPHFLDDSTNGKRTPKEFHKMNQKNMHHDRHLNSTIINTSIEQTRAGPPGDSQFPKVSISRAYMQQNHLQTNHQHYQQQKSLNNYKGKERMLLDSTQKPQNVMSNDGRVTEHHNLPDSKFYSNKTVEKYQTEQNSFERSTYLTSGKEFLATEYPQVQSPLGPIQRVTASTVSNDISQRKATEDMGITGTKSHTLNVLESVVEWKKTESSVELGNRRGFVITQTENKISNRGSGISESGPQDIDFRKMKDQFKFSAETTDTDGFGSRLQKNSTRLKYPPVPQSNYDLNRQIYDTMTGINTNKLPQQALPTVIEKEAVQCSPSRNRVNVPGESNLRHLISHNVPIQDTKGSDSSSMKYSKSGNHELHVNSYVQFHKGVVDSPSKRAPYQNKGPSSMGQTVFSTLVQTQQAIVMDQHRPPTPRLGVERHDLPPSRTSLPLIMERNRSISVKQGLVSTSTTSHAPDHIVCDYLQKKLLEDKVSQSIDALGSKGSNLSPKSATCRLKRESPLDLSVKTVRQSADSTAKDDSETYFQNFMNLSQSNQKCQEGRFPVVGHQNGVAAGAPKIDFTPNFAGFHVEGPRSNASLHHKPEMSVLPPVESFKTFSGRLGNCREGQDDTKRSEYTSSPVCFSKGISKTSQTHQRVTTDVRRQLDDLKSDTAKCISNSLTRSHSAQPKIQKIDSWKLAFDEHIEQRLNSARASLYGAHNAEFSSSRVDSSKSPGQSSSILRHSSGSSHHESSNMYPQIPVQTSATPYNPAYVQQQPQCQSATPQTPQEKIEQLDGVGHSPDPEQIIKQISKGVMPDYKLLQDKNVLSVLRSSLEEKEAKLMQLREAAKRKEKYKEHMIPEVPKKRFQPYSQALKFQRHDRQSLPPFGALTMERLCSPDSNLGGRPNTPKSVDSIKIDIEPVHNRIRPGMKGDPEKVGTPNMDPSPRDGALGPPTDLDGLAAFLAARIRTKGELKQVGPMVDPDGTDAGRSSRDPGDQSSAIISRESLVTEPPNGNRKSPIFSSTVNPPKLVRETRLMTPTRRRLFSHAEDSNETPTTSTPKTEYSTLPLRDRNGIRSSSETSVFDFRESDSDGEMPVLERQTLEGLRRDRKTFGSKQNVSVIPSDDISEPDKPEAITELDQSNPDPLWDTAFDMFVEQLEKRPPKRSVKKRKTCSRTPYVALENDGCKYHVEESTQDNFAAYLMSEDDDEAINMETKENAKVEIKQEIDEDNENQKKVDSERFKVEDEYEKNNKCFIKLNVNRERRKAKDAKTELKNGTPVEEMNKCNVTRRIKTRGKTGVVKKNNNINRRQLPMESDLTTGEDDNDQDDGDGEEDEDDDDDDSLSLSGLESESTESGASSESSNSNYTSDDYSENEGPSTKRMRIQTRLQTRSSKQKQVKSMGMRLRSKALSRPAAKCSSKNTKRLRRRQGHRKKRRKKDEYYPCGKKKKPSFGDGSHFRPGWEEECYKFKQQLRMPEKLISISVPPKRSSASLPDLDPYRNSPSLDSSDVSLGRKSLHSKATAAESEESELDGANHKPKSETTNAESLTTTSLLKSRNGKKSQSSRILNMLVKKYGNNGTGKTKQLRSSNDRKSPRILPKATNKPELLPTPGLGIGKENVMTNKRKHPGDVGKRKFEEDSSYLTFFRKKTVNNFKEAFKQNIGLLSQEFTSTVLTSRTRTQTRDLKKKTTLIEVFGEERPASAPPLGREDVSTDQEKVGKMSEKKKTKAIKKACGGVVTRGRGKLIRSGRPGLRSTAVLRSNKAVQISKRHLNGGRKRSSMELLRIRAMQSKKFSYLVSPSENTGPLPMTKKRLKLRSVRRKFRSGFDYIRKKKKMKKDGDSADGSIKEKKLPLRSTAENVEDIQNEIKNWVINKGLGETILHRAARLGYTDVAAYCLEKMDSSPSPRDNAGYTPLHEACSRGHLDIAKLLLMYGASVSESAKGGIRPLHEAAENGFTELIRLLLSFGADPLLETYTGHTALSLVTDEEARRLIQYHLADVQGNVAPVWNFQGPSSVFDPIETGYDPLSEPPSPGPDLKAAEYDFEISCATLPPLYRLTTDRDPNCVWVLLRDLLTYTKTKSKDAILKQVETAAVREMKLSDFYEQSRCCDLLGGDRPSTKTNKVMLVQYNDRVRRLLDVERVLL
ncbi:hypothetical protein RUM44_010600 [Polyplax serrata]|uniref:Uncharacterized protein n=1 Tax=Polyplax serrata TaxID=468196 RepID=A0ABR1AXI0_POLSC